MIDDLKRCFQVIFDLHLPSMANLTGKRSSQSLLLRVLKVVIQLREAAKKSFSKVSGPQRAGLSRGECLLSLAIRVDALDCCQGIHAH